MANMMEEMALSFVARLIGKTPEEMQALALQGMKFFDDAVTHLESINQRITNIENLLANAQPIVDAVLPAPVKAPVDTAIEVIKEIPETINDAEKVVETVKEAITNVENNSGNSTAGNSFNGNFG